MPVLFNQEGLAEDLHPEQADAALAAGTHTIPLVSPDGLPSAVPAAEREARLAEGYRLPSTEQLTSLLDQGKYGSTGQTIGAAAEGAAEALTLGTSGAAEAAVGKALGVEGLSAEAQLKRSEQSPLAHGVGEVVGTVAPALVGDEAGLLNVVGKAGALGERAAKKLVTAGEEKLASRVAGWFGRGAAESALMTSEHVLNERMLGDPDATAEHALAEVGVSAILGGSGGAILGKAVESGEHIARRVLDKEGSLIAGLRKLKPNVDEIDAAAERLGVEALPGQRSASRTVQDLQSQVAKEPTIAGRKEQMLVDQQYEAIQGAMQGALGDASAMTKVEAGDALKAGIKQSVEESYRPIEEMYAFLKSHSENVPLDAEELARVAKHIPNIEGASKRPRSPEGLFTKRLAEDLPLQATVEDLKKLRTSVGNEANPLTRPELRYYSGAVQEMLDELEEKSLLKHVNQMVAEGRLPEEVASNLISTRTVAKEGYKELMQTLGEVAEATGKRKVYGVKHFLDHLEDVSSEKLVDRLFAKKDSRFLAFLSDRFPQQAQDLARYQKSEIAKKAFEGHMVRPTKVMRQVSDLSEEAQRFLFSPEDLAKISDAQTLLEAMPKDVNPSGTAKAMSWHDRFNPFRHGPETAVGGLLGGPVGAVAGYAAGVAGPEVSTMVKRSLLQRLASGTPEEAAQHGALSRLFDLSQKTAGYVAKAARAAVSREAAERLTMSHDERDRTAEKVKKLADDPSKLVERMTKLTEGVSDHAPDTSTAVTAAAGRAVQYLASKAPREAQASPFGPKLPPSELSLSQFRRSAESVLDPVGVMSRVGDGTLSKTDVEALHTVYPRLYQAMRMSLAGEIASAVARKEHVPYEVRLAASLFLGQPIEPSISPRSVASAQAVLAASTQPAPPAPKRSTAALSKVGAQFQTPEQAAAARRSGQGR